MWSLPFRSSNQEFILLSQISYACHMTYKTNPHSNAMCYIVQSMEHLCMHFHQTSCYLPPPQLKYSHQHPVLNTLTVCSSYSERSTLTPTQYIQKNSHFGSLTNYFNPLNPELNPICYLLALLGAHHFLHVSRISVKSLTLRRLMSYIWSTHS